jgi:hypothetical protein
MDADEKMAGLVTTKGEITPEWHAPIDARWRWSAAYYLVLALWLLLVYQQFFAEAIGVAASTWFWKANEVYVIAIAVPLFWDLVATVRRPGGVIDYVDTATDTPGPLVRRVAWYGALGLLLVMSIGPLFETLFGNPLPQRIITLRDCLLGLVALSIYFDWSRGFWRTLNNGAPRLVSATARAIVLTLAVAINVLIYQQPVKDLLGSRVAEALDFQAEAFGVILLVPIYFDVVIPLTKGDPLRAVAGPREAPHRHVVLAAWVALMAGLAYVGQGAARDWFDNAFGQWFVRSAEAPIAAIVFTAYFEMIRSLDGVRRVEVVR